MTIFVGYLVRGQFQKWLSPLAKRPHSRTLKIEELAEMPMKRYKSAAERFPTRREPRANMRDLNIFYQE